MPNEKHLAALETENKVSKLLVERLCIPKERIIHVVCSDRDTLERTISLGIDVTENSKLQLTGTDLQYNGISIVAFTKKEIFELFNDVWISSYMTKDSMLDYYCQMNNIKISYYHISNYAIVEGYRFDYPKEFERLCICQNEKYNLNFALSKAWYKRENNKGKIITNKEPACLKSLASAFRNFLKYVCQNENPNSYYWTTFKASQSDIPKKYISQKRFLECNKKATNEYDQCTAVGYLCNRFINPNIINVFADKGIQFDNDQYALSELLQFVYRSNLRVEDSDKIVNVFIPAKRMRMLLWNFQQKYMTLRNNISA
ncbi:hypothetical protein [uncultured Phascolarctobacterium sp.]|uniref:hypothetical protein n=1 Tax=uncultured Phascolarctobacterium sp. TaxID=512296 RepID=UPI0027D9C3BC|nr:hypothetical protein [uncultured Phascolarctobacterium sp.]